MGPDPRAFGSGTTPRFAVLVLAAAATMWNCWQVLAGAVLGTPYRLATERCVGALVSALGVDGQDIDRAAAAAPAEGAAVAATVDACSTRVGATAAAIAVAAVVVLVAGAALAYWLWPSWHIRRRRLIAFPAAAFPVPAAKLAKLAGNTEVRFLLDPADNRVDGRAFGRYGRRYVILTRGLLERWRKNDGDGSVDAVVSHELAHIRNRDIDPAYAAVWTWRLLVLLGGVPFGCWVLVELAMGDRRTALGYGWRIVALLGLTFLIRNGLLRAREYYADLRAGRSCPDQLRRLLRTAPDPTRRARLRARFGLHPSVAKRRRMLDEPGELLAPRALSLVTIGLSAMLAYDLVDAVTAVAGLRTPIAPLAGMTLTTLVATAGIAQAALRSALWVRVAGDDHPWRGSAFHIPLVALAHGLALAAGLGLGRLLSLDPVAHGSIRHTWAATREFVSGWAFVLGMSCVAVTACVHVAAHTWLPVVATVTRPRVALATVAIGAAVLMLPWLPSLLWAYFLYARLPWEESGAPSWVTGELMQRQRLPAGLLGGWGLLAAVVALTLLLAAPRLRRAHPPTQSWTGTSEATRLQPPLGIRATVGTAAAASFLTLTIVSEYGFHTATWPGADVTSMALMASSPASRAIVASTAGSKWMLCHQSGTLASGLRSECLRYGPDPRRQECSAHPFSCRPSVHVAPGKGLVTRVAPPEGYRPAIGETVVFDGARAGWVTTDMAYRTALVIAAGGDRVTCAGAGAPILVNGQPPVDGGILFPAGRIGAEAFDQTVPEGGMWVLGTAARPQDGSDRHLGEGGGVVAASSVLLYFAEK